MTDKVLIKLAQYQTETRNQKHELKNYVQKLLKKEEEIKELKELNAIEQRHLKKRIYPLASSENNHMLSLIQRENLINPIGMKLAAKYIKEVANHRNGKFKTYDLLLYVSGPRRDC